MKKWHAVAMLLVGATLLGGTVLREPIASAAQSVSAGRNNAEGPRRTTKAGWLLASFAGKHFSELPIGL